MSNADPILSKKILIVDDSSVTRRAVEALLYSDKFTNVRVVDSAKKALEVIEREPDVDCVVSDVQMPGMSGLELYDKALEIRRDLPFIFMSASSRHEEVLKKRAIDFISKSKLEELPSRIEKLFRSP